MQANIEGMTEALNLIRGQAKNYHRKSELRVIRELETKLATLISKRKAEQNRLTLVVKIDSTESFFTTFRLGVKW